MTKKLVLALLVLALLVPGALFATGSAEPGGGKVEVVKLFSSVGAWKALLEKEIADWNASVGKEKGIRIDIETNIDKYSEVLTIALESGNHPDIYYIDGRVDQCVTKGWAKAIEDIKGGKEWLEGYKGMLKPIRHQYEGKTYTVPFEFLPIKLAYNKDLFKKAGIVDASGAAKPPATWKEMVADAKKITEVGKGVEYGYGFTYAWVAGFRRLLVKAYIPSVGHFWFDHRTGKYDFSAFAPAFEYLLQMKKDGSLFPGPESIQIDPIRAQFSAGNVGMITAPAYDVGVYNDQFPAKCDWGIAELPVDDVNAPRYKTPSLERAAWGISSKVSKEREAKVFEAYKFLFSDASMARLYKECAFIPYKPEIVKLAGEVKPKVGFKEFSANLQNDYGVFPFPDALVTVEGRTYNQVMESIFIGQTPIKEGLADLDKRYNKALDDAVKEGKIKLANYMSNVDLKITK